MHDVELCWLVECTMIWPPCGTVLTGGMHDDLTAMWNCVDWWNARWSDRHVELCWLMECTMWNCVDWWNARWSDRHVVLCWLVECTTKWPQCGTELTDEVHDNLSRIPAFKWANAITSCGGFVSQFISLLLTCYALAWQENMAATLRVFCAEY